jgi:hypothetical protein
MFFYSLKTSDYLGEYDYEYIYKNSYLPSYFLYVNDKFLHLC